MLDDKRVIKYKLYGNNLINMSKKTTEFPQKTSIVSWDLLTWLDSEDATLSTKDKVFSVNNIWNRIFTDRSTSDLAEWTNLYYTEARVTANTTVVWLWTTKADKTNVLEKDNTTAYTPTLDYHPATKKYVDNYSLPDATTSSYWKVQLADSNDVYTRSWNDVVTSWLLGYEQIVASNTIRASADTERTDVSWSPVKKKEFKIWAYRKGWTCRVIFEAKWTLGTSAYYWKVIMYKNWVFQFPFNNTGSEHFSGVYQTFSYNFSVIEWDLVQVYLQSANVEWTERTAYIRNVKLCFDEIQTSLIPTVNLD